MSTTTSIHHIADTYTTVKHLDSCKAFTIKAFVKDTVYNNEITFFFDTQDELETFLREALNTINTELNNTEPTLYAYDFTFHHSDGSTDDIEVIAYSEEEARAKAKRRCTNPRETTICLTDYREV